MKVTQTPALFRPSAFFISLLLTVMCLLHPSISSAATINLNQSDGGGQSSFINGANWVGGNEPMAGNSYVVTGKVLRTPETNNMSYAFSGDSLTIGSGGRLAYKGSGASAIITVNNLVLSGGRVLNWQPASNRVFTLAGNIHLASASYFEVGANYDSIVVNSQISGNGALQIEGGAAQATNGLFLNNINTYTGGTIIKSNSLVTAQSTGAFGSGDVIIEGGRLVLQSASAISSGANLLLSSSLANNSIEINHSGITIISGLSFDNGETFAAAGTWGAIGNSLADHTSNLITGDGLLHVIPEPRTVAFAFGALALALVALRRLR